MIDVKNFSILNKRIKERVVKILYNNGCENWIIREFIKRIDEAKNSESEIKNVLNWINENNNVLAYLLDYTLIRDDFKKEGVDIHEWKAERYYKEVRGRSVFMPKLFADDLIKEFSFITTDEKPTPEMYVYDYEEGIYKNNGINFIGSFTSEFLGTEKNKHLLAEIIMQVQHTTFRDREILTGTYKNLICLNNGVYDIRENKLLSYSPDLIFLNKIPINYNSKADCPKIKEFLKEVLLEEDLNFINEFIGYCLYRSSNLFKKGFILLGERDTAKTTFIKLLVSFVGVKNSSSVALQKIGDRFSSYFLYGKYINIADDLSSQDVNNTGPLKQALGDGYIECEIKHGPKFHFMNSSKFIFATNKIPLPKDIDDDAYYSRWYVLRFLNEFTNDNNRVKRDLIQELTTQEELEGLLIYALSGLKRLLDNKKFSREQSVDEVKLIMHKSGSSIASFCLDRLNKGVYDDWISKEEMNKEYSKYCDEFKLANRGMKKLGTDLIMFASYIIDSKLGTDKRGWRNVKFKNSDKVEKEQVLEFQ